MNTYKAKLNIEVEIDAFSEDDAREYISDIFNVDDEVKSVNITNIVEK
jgi:hypothetical protein